MCGIFGVVHADALVTPNSVAVDRALDVLRHRGPDDRGVVRFPGAVLGARRLSIVDIAGGHQPMIGDDGRTAVAHNGEVYNFDEVRRSLESRGARFHTRSDTEVVLRACEAHGPEALASLRGMFAFAYFDSTERRLLLARDRLGVKPLYYRATDEAIVFASEPKAILAFDPAAPRTLDEVALDHFLTFEYVPAPRTLWREIRKLAPGHFLEWRAGRVEVRRYWELRAGPPPASEKVAADALRAQIADAVRGELVSDVPVGVLLSGGIDSSTVAAFVERAAPGTLRTFSLRIPDSGYDESSHARMVADALSAQHTEIDVTAHPSEVLDDLVRAFDDPVSDSSIFPTYLLARETHRAVKVVLSGDGGDELFAGYDTYVAEKLSHYYGRIPKLVRERVVETILGAAPPQATKKGVVNRAKRFAEGAALPDDLGAVRWMIFLGEMERSRLYGAGLSERLRGIDPYAPVRERLAAGPSANGDAIDRALRTDLSLYLPDDILAKVDRTSMAASLEVRVPLLDHRVVELAMSIPSAWKMKGLRRKAILRRAVRGLVPDAVLRRGKEGFSAPMKSWLRGDLRGVVDDALSDRAVSSRGLFQVERIRELVAEHQRERADHSHRIFALTLFELWCRRYLDRSGSAT
ncbi:MAG: asparagine synthase (glutamine-hydrolyzing) [Planctomycetes bacterium]|nr:asparagine synthase (glutamine-hydrolyzing) [Planctomycetota bacterium]MBI3843845.1 asparagine synthase (glutamine-hydrolyzing) [Planctomycetota bacterium]